MPYDPDLQPLLDAKADKTALAGKTNTATTTALTTRVKVLEAKVAALEGQPPPPPPLPPLPGPIAITPTTANINGLVNSSPIGATFQFAAGTYKRLTVNPKDGQTFLGGPGVILDGENAAKAAFIGPASNVAPKNVTIRQFEIKNYTPTETPGWNEGAITSKWYEAQQGGDGWTVDGCDVHHNRGAGVMLTDRGIIRSSHIHHNYAIGVKLYWAPNGGLVEDNEIDNNNFDGNADFNETGGTKFAYTTGLVVRRNNVHHNHGDGLWTDIDNGGYLCEDNICDDNTGAGIFHEISYSATIRRNIVRRNGSFNRGWLWEGGIMVAGSQDVTIEDNVVEDCFNGITLIQQARGSGPLGLYLLKNVTVQRNKVKGGRTGVVQDVGDNTIFTSRNLKFLDNDYTSTIHVWAGADRTWAQWQGYGHDLTGSNV